MGCFPLLREDPGTPYLVYVNEEGFEGRVREIAEVGVRYAIGAGGRALSGLRKGCAELGYAEVFIDGKISGVNFGGVWGRRSSLRGEEFGFKFGGEGEV